MGNQKCCKCRAVMPFGDDHGDNSCTFRCMRIKGHEGDHREWGNLHGKYPYSLEWIGDYRDNKTCIYFYWSNVEEQFNEFKKIAEEHNLQYEVERDGEDINIYLSGHAEETYYAELKKIDKEEKW